MRLSVGDILILVLLVWLGASFSLSSKLDLDWGKEKLKDVKTGVQSLFTLFKTGEEASENYRERYSRNERGFEETEQPMLGFQENAGRRVNDKADKKSPQINEGEEAAPERPKTAAKPVEKLSKASSRSTKKQKSSQSGTWKVKRTNGKTVKKAPKTVRKTRTKPARPKAPPAPKESGDDFVGNYVALELKTGRVIRGILEERTRENYKLQLPGMGPFVYPARDVRSIALVR